MPERIREHIKQTRPFDGPEQEAMISLMVATSALRCQSERVCNRHGIFGSQYNILRILAGGPAEGYPRCEIIDRMIDRGPDVTRLVDALEDKGLVQRERSHEDRRVILHRITDEGRAFLQKVTADLRPIQDAFGEKLSEDQLRELTRLCTTIVESFDEEGV